MGAWGWGCLVCSVLVLVFRFSCVVEGYCVLLRGGGLSGAGTAADYRRAKFIIS